MEKLKTQSGVIYDLLPNGASFGDETATIIFKFPEGKTYEEVEADMIGNNRLHILDSENEPIETRTDYCCLDGITKKNDYVIGTTQVKTGTDEDGEILYTTEEILGTALIVYLKKTDVRTELEKAQTQIAGLNDTVDMLILSGLEEG